MTTFSGERSPRLCSVLFLLLLGFGSVASAAPARQPEGAIRDRYIVTVARDTKDVDAVAKTLASKHNGRLLKVWRSALKGFWVEMPTADAALLARDPRVVSMEQDAAMEFSGAAIQATGPNTVHPVPPIPSPVADDAMQADKLLWHLTYLSNRNRLPFPDQLSDFFEYRYSNDGSYAGGTKRVRIYMIDVGVLGSHAELKRSNGDSKVTAGANVASTGYPASAVTADPFPRDDSAADEVCSAMTADLPARQELYWHGTAVASAVVGTHVGVAKDAELISVTSVSCAGPFAELPRTTTGLLLSALDYVLETEETWQDANENKARPAVLTMSTFRSTNGVECFSCIRQPDLSIVEQAVTALIDNGIPVFASANNGKVDACTTTPARLSRRGGLGRVITVGGVAAVLSRAPLEDKDQIWINDHNNGVKDDDGSNFGQCVDIFAPASFLPLAFPGPNENEWAAGPRHFGTSFSAPMVAGLAARILAASADRGTFEDIAEDKSKIADHVWDLLAANASPFGMEKSGSPPKLPLLGGDGSPRVRAYLGSATFTKPLPREVRLESDGEVDLSVEVLETGVKYQWYRGKAGDDKASNVITGATSANYSATMAGSYWVRVAYASQDLSGHYADSTTVTVLDYDSQPTLPAIIEPPKSQWLDSTTTSATLTAKVATPIASDTFLYEWHQVSPRLGLAQEANNSGFVPSGVPSPALEGVIPELVVTPPCAGTSKCEAVLYKLRIRLPGSTCPSDDICGVESDTVQVRPCPSLLRLGGTLADGFPLEYRKLSKTQDEYVLAPKPPNGDLTSDLGARWFSVDPNGTREALIVTLEDDSEITFINRFLAVVKPGRYQLEIGNTCRTAVSETFNITAGELQDYYRTTYSIQTLPEGPMLDDPETQTEYDVPGGSSYRFSVQAELIEDESLYPQPNLEVKWTIGSGSPVSGRTVTVGPVTLQTEVQVTVKDLLSEKTWTRSWKLIPPIPIKLPSGLIGDAGRCGELAADEDGVVLINKTSLGRIVALAPRITDLDGNDVPPTSSVSNPSLAKDKFIYEWRVGNTTVKGPAKGLENATYDHTIAAASATVELLVRAAEGADPASLHFLIEPNLSNPACNVATDPSQCRFNCGRRRAVAKDGFPQAQHIFTPGESAVLGAPEEVLPSTYVWYKRIGLADTQIGNTEEINVVFDVPAEYYVVTNNANGESISYHLVAILGGGAASAVTINPASRIIAAGQTTTFTAVFSAADANTRYEWRRGPSRRLSSTVIGRSAVLTLSDLQDNAMFWCRVLHPNPNDPEVDIPYESELVTVTVNCTPSVGGIVTAKPARVGRGQRPMLVPTGTGKLLLYTWMRSDSDNPTPVFESNQMNPKPEITKEITVFSATAVDACGTSGSLGQVSVYLCVPAITEQPTSLFVAPGDPTTLTVAALPANDGQALTVRWYASGDTTLSSPLGQGLTFNPVVTPGTSASFFATVSALCGDGVNSVVKSDIATVEVCALPELIVPETTYLSFPGILVTLVATDLSQSTTYQWYQGVSGNTSHPLPGETGETLRVSADVTTQYWCRATNQGLCTTDGATITLQVCSSPDITTQPQSQPVFLNGTTTLSVATASAATYQWQTMNGSGQFVDVAGATSATFQTPPLTATQRHRVVVTAGHCSVTSNDAEIYECAYPSVVGGGGDKKLGLGESAPLSLPGMSPVLVKDITWYLGNVGDVSTPLLIGTGTNLTYETNPAETQTRQYWAKFVSGGCTSRTDVFTVYICKPQITSQPSGILIAPGSSTTLTVSTTAIAGQAYQWYRGTPGVTTDPVAGATAASLTVTPSVTTSYWCRVSTPCALTIDSAAATVEVCVAPSITAITQSPVALASGGSTVLSIAASGQDLTYQWYRGNSGNTTQLINGATTSQYTASPTATTNYWCRVTSRGLCVSNSSTVTVDVCTTPAIVTQPASQSMFGGGNVTLSVAATGSHTLSYQWYVGASGNTSTPVIGATSASVNVAPSSTTSYWCRITASVCSIDSAAATVSLCIYPAIVNAAGATQNVYSGDRVTLNLPALSPAAEMTITWYAGASGNTSTPLISGVGTSLPYQTPPLTANAQYWAQFVHNGCTSKTTTYTINVCKPTITVDPQPSTIVAGSQASLSVSATGSPLTYQWYAGNSGVTTNPISGATGATFTPSPSSTTTYWVRVTGCTTSADSSAATVTVCNPPVVNSVTRTTSTSQIGGTGSFTASATGVGLSYQWYKGQSGETTRPISGATSATYSFTLQTTEYYWVRVTSSCNNLSVNSAATIYSVAPAITTQPAGTTIPRGTATTLSVTANGTFLTYQWYKGLAGDTAFPVAGATSSTFTTPALMNAAAYWVHVLSGTAGLNSTHAQIDVCDGPSVTSTIGSTNVGTTYTLTVNVYVPQRPQVKYHWYRGVPGSPADSTDLGVGASSRMFFNVTTSATYWVRVWWLDDTCYTDTLGKTIP